MLFSVAVAGKKETIYVDDVYDEYGYDSVYDPGVDGRGKGKGSDYEMYDPHEGNQPKPDGNGGFLLSDSGGMGSLHKMCGNSPIPVIVCNGCSAGYPRYSKPCNEPENGNSEKFKCGVRCGEGYKASIKKMKCIGGRWKKLPANGKIRCLKKKKN